jgi:hypothetical protein
MISSWGTTLWRTSPLLTTQAQPTRFWTSRRSRCSSTPSRQSSMSRPKEALQGILPQDMKTKLLQQGLATAMVRGTPHTTSTAASGVDVMGQSADRGGGWSSRSRWSSRRASVYHCILGVLDDSVNGYERDCQGQHRQSHLETLGISNNSLNSIGRSELKMRSLGWSRD